MTPPDMTELRELRERLQGAAEDLRIAREQLQRAQAEKRDAERALEEMTHHRNRLLAEKEVAWGAVLSLDKIASEIPAEPERDPNQLPLLEERGELEC